MISKQASTLPRRLLRRYGASDPFELADCLGITILECHDFKLQKGAFKVILNNCFIFINANLSTEMKKLVCAHELGHALLHRPLGKTDTGLMYEANLFAANLLLDEEEIDSLAREGFDIVQIAHNLGTNVNLPLLKLQQINSDNHLHLPDMPSRNFLGTISDDAGHL